eukprot:TRINITY_DN17619_c0_g1_i1.p4 TRINITY_DN17619_c0_g1~~TRINITY_DN17619_c0_g1_i1.p4  ORF type:complete len:126 (+),score=15.80 TRINITY_DN17619_c0_g1_i1:235-612(+)
MGAFDGGSGLRIGFPGGGDGSGDVVETIGRVREIGPSGRIERAGAKELGTVETVGALRVGETAARCDETEGATRMDWRQRWRNDGQLGGTGRNAVRRLPARTPKKRNARQASARRIAKVDTCKRA